MCLISVCLCRNDLLGLEGMVTQKNPDENVNHLPSAASHCVVDSTFVANGDSTDASKRFTIFKHFLLVISFTVISYTKRAHVTCINRVCLIFCFLYYQGFS